MDPVRWEEEPPELRSPILVAAFSGWNDAASAATSALEAIAADLVAERLATIDPEEFYDFQVNRPTIHLTEGRARGVEWPANVLLSAPAESAERDLVIFSGVEPNLRWRTFAEAVAGCAERLGVELVVTLGSLIADVAHTRPVPVTGLASDPDLINRLGFQAASYEGPTGIVGVLHAVCHERGLNSASLWAAVPHYVAAVPNPKASLALMRRFETLSGVALEGVDLEEATGRFEEQVDAAVTANPEIADLVQKLEAEQPDETSLADFDVPSGDALAREFQRFLKQRGDDG